MNKFKLNEVVRITHNIDMTDTGGPYIPLGTRARILRRRKSGQSVWVDVYGYGQRELLITDIRSGNS